LRTLAIASAVPLYRGGGRHRTPGLIGTGFPVQIGPKKVLVTAAHVTACLENEHFYIPNGNTLTAFDCRITHMGHANRCGHDDPIDLALIDLDDEQSKRLSRFRFVKLHEMEFPTFSTAPDAAYSFVGYPASRNKSEFRVSEIAPTLFAFTGTPIAIDNYGRFGFAFQTHLVVVIDEKSATGRNRAQTLPSTKGLSGGPVWLLARLPDTAGGSLVPLLAGMAIEHKRGGLIAVRTWVLLQTMRAIYPDLAPLIEEFPNFRLTIEPRLPRKLILSRC
jgi:hypothetical protein